MSIREEGMKWIHRHKDSSVGLVDLWVACLVVAGVIVAAVEGGTLVALAMVAVVVATFCTEPA